MELEVMFPSLNLIISLLHFFHTLPTMASVAASATPSQDSLRSAACEYKDSVPAKCAEHCLQCRGWEDYRRSVANKKEEGDALLTPFLVGTSEKDEKGRPIIFRILLRPVGTLFQWAAIPLVHMPFAEFNKSKWGECFLRTAQDVHERFQRAFGPGLMSNFCVLGNLAKKDGQESFDKAHAHGHNYTRVDGPISFPCKVSSTPSDAVKYDAATNTSVVTDPAFGLPLATVVPWKMNFTPEFIQFVRSKLESV